MTVKKKQKKAEATIQRSGTRVVGRVNTDFAGFVWGLSDDDIISAAHSIAKHIEVTYQVQLMRSSGFGQDDDF